MSKSNYYLETFLKLRCSPDFLLWKLFPNIKEVTESFGMFEAVAQNFPKLEFRDPNVTIVVVGDGGTPRTAVTFACRTKWSTISVDPELSNKHWGDKVKRLKCYKDKIENISIEIPEDHFCIVIFPHSHVKIDDSLPSIKAGPLGLGVVACPCCVPLYIKGQPHHIEYDDHRMHTPKNLVKIWKEVNMYDFTRNKTGANS